MNILCIFLGEQSCALKELLNWIKEILRLEQNILTYYFYPHRTNLMRVLLFSIEQLFLIIHRFL